MKPQAPSFLLDKPEPQIKNRQYNGRKIMAWEGRVEVSSILGWVDNPRIELAKKTLTSRVGERPVTQEEIFDLMKHDKDVKLGDLRDDIIKNGLREPIVLSFLGKLLDGNRRFFAVKYALENMPQSNSNFQDLKYLNAYVLAEDATKEDEQNVLIEENFSASLKIEWPDYVKASKVMEAYQAGLQPDAIAKKFGWKKAKVSDTIKIHEIIEEFTSYATAEKNHYDENEGGLGLSEQEAETIAAKNYQFFNEAKKSFFDPLKSNFAFKIQFFNWIVQEKFSSFSEVRIAFEAWKHPEAKAAILRQDPTAAKSAQAILEYNKRITHTTDEMVGRIETFVEFLKEMSAVEIKSISENTRNNLKQALEMVIKMSQAASE